MLRNQIDQLTPYEVSLAEQLGVFLNEDSQKAAEPITTTSMLSSDGVGAAYDIPTMFIDLVRDQSVLLKQVRLFRTNKPSGDIAKIDVQGHVTEVASENGTSTETRRHTPTSTPYVTKKLRSQFDITAETEEDNIEGPSGVSTILNALMKAISNDMETLAIMGDDSQAGSDDYSRLIKANDGYHIQTASGSGSHIVNCGGRQVSWRLLSEMIKHLPTKFRGNGWKRRFKWLMSPDAKICLMEEAQIRATGLGDGVWSDGGDNLRPLGIDVVEIPLFPQDLALSGTQSLGTFILLVDPKNFIYVIQRQIKVHREFIPRYDKTEVTVFSRPDFIIENTDEIVKSINVSLDTTAARYGA